MASDRPPGDWRHQGGAKRPTGGGRTSRRAWQPGGEEQKKAGGKPRSPWFRRITAGVVTLTLLGVAVWLIYQWIPARYPVLAFAGDNDGISLAVAENVAGIQTRNELADLASGGRDRPKLAGTPPVSADEQGVKFHIDDKPRNLVIYLTANGGADAQGAFLLVAPPNPASAANVHKVYVSTLLGHIDQARSGKGTLLVFDSTRATTGWANGLIFNDFARALVELEPKIQAVPGLAVICASDEDQRSWLFEERKMSVFGYYFLEALRGDGHEAGTRITAASAFERLKPNVENWAIAHRRERQTPILLPRGDGLERARNIDLAATPSGGYTSPKTLDLRSPDRKPLDDAWARAERLRTLNPPPEANNPLKWRTYLELLLRWERLHRIGADTGAVSTQVGHLAGQLETPVGGAVLTCLSAALPAAEALGQPTPPRVARSKQVLKTLLDGKDGVTLKQLTAANDELAAIFEKAGPPPVEVHFVRKLHEHLVADKRPRSTPPLLLQQAIRVRLLAEEAAWRFGAKGLYPYAEYVYPWVGAHVETGDKLRHWGQDLLLSPQAEDWKQAEKYLTDAETAYTKAVEDGQKVVAALATRDRVLAQLPYYARWLAAYRGDRPEVATALGHAERAARGARELSQMTVAPGTPIADLQAKQSTVANDFTVVTDAFAAEIKALTTTTSVNPSDWHALDAVLTVPFIPARERGELLARLQHVSQQLETNRQQVAVGEPQVQLPPARQAAGRNRQLASALLGLPPAPEAGPNDWVAAYRAAGDKIGTDLRELPDKVNARTEQARNILSLSDAGTHLAEGAFLMRLMDPAAPLVKGPDPIANDQAFRRHRLLLWQAHRVTTEGWAEIGSTSIRPEWYCRTVSGSLTESASALIGKVAESVNQSTTLRPEQLHPWQADYTKERNHRHVELSLTAERKRVVADEPEWVFPFTFQKQDGAAPVGYPVSWVVPPSDRFAVPNADLGRQQTHRELFGEQPPANRPVAGREVTFKAPGNPKDEATPGKLVSHVLYRGQVYTQETELIRVGTPTREWVYAPPEHGADTKAAFAITADPKAVAGTVTILIDLTRSMNRPVKENTKQTRLEAVKLAVRKVLKDLPEGTWVTLAFFYGSARTKNGTETMTVKAFGKPEKLDGANWDRLFRPFDDVTAASLEEKAFSTPLAGAIEQVLLPSRRTEFWPKEFTGSPTLIVVTDGEDTWGNWTGYPNAYPGGKEPGKLALDALRDTDRDTRLHIVFFGMEAKKLEEAESEEDRARAQFNILKDATKFTDLKRTPAVLHSERDADGLATYVKEALLPKFHYGINAVQDFVWPTLGTDGGIKVSPALPRGDYKLWGNPGQDSRQSLELRPAARLMVEAQRNEDGTFKFILPAYGLKVAQKRHIPFQKRDTPDGVYAAIPEITLTTPAEGARLRFVTCLEPGGERKVATPLSAPRPLREFVWWDVKDREGKDAPYLRIENRWHTWAPTWELTANRWQLEQVDSATVRRPVVTGYWLGKEFPAAVGNFEVESRHLKDSFKKVKPVHRFGNTEVTLLSVDAEYFDPKNANIRGLPEGTYLTVRVKTAKAGDPTAPGEPVFLSPPNWKGDERPWVLHQHHAYFGEHGRYTARFGPISPNDPAETIAFSLYSVDALKKASWDVSVRIPDGPLPNDKAAMQDLTQEPDKK